MSPRDSPRSETIASQPAPRPVDAQSPLARKCTPSRPQTAQRQQPSWTGNFNTINITRLGGLIAKTQLASGCVSCKAYQHLEITTIRKRLQKSERLTATEDTIDTSNSTAPSPCTTALMRKHIHAEEISRNSGLRTKARSGQHHTSQLRTWMTATTW